MNSILDILGCGAKLEGEEDAAGTLGSAWDEALHVTGGPECHMERVAEVIFARQRHTSSAL